MPIPPIIPMPPINGSTSLNGTPIDIDKSLFPIKKVSKEANAISKRLEPLKTIDKQREFNALCDKNPVMRSRADSNRRGVLKPLPL